MDRLDGVEVIKMTFELSNAEREYFGLDPIEKHWEKVILKGDAYRPESCLYYEDDVIKRHIVSTDLGYFERHYNDKTKDRTILLPKTSKGKEKKLTASVLEQRQPIGVYLEVTNHGVIRIGNYATQTTFYSSRWHQPELPEEKAISETVTDFISNSPDGHLLQIKEFKKRKRKHVRFKSGDYFSFKLNRTHFGFGRILLDINKIRKMGLINKQHGLGMLMGPPVLVQLFAFESTKLKVDIFELDNAPKLPSDVMMDNILLYGEYEIIGHKELKEDDFEFPISYGESIDRRPVVFLQWGMIHRELPVSTFDKYTVEDNLNYPEGHYYRKVTNPFGYYSIGFRPHFDTHDILRTIDKGFYDFDASTAFSARFDLRNPLHKSKRDEILLAFGLDPNATYEENCKITGTVATTEIVKRVQG